MSDPEETDSCVPDAQETFYKSLDESSENKTVSETIYVSLSESQDFHLVDSETETMTETTKPTQDGEANHQKSSDSPHISDVSHSKKDDEIITNDKEDKNIEDKNVENETLKSIEENVSNDVHDTEKKDELSDEDEIIEGTPPQDYLPSRKIASNIYVTSLKRKAEFSDDSSAKISRMMSMKDTSNVKQLEDEESNQPSCGSDDSYQDLLKNIDNTVVIAETQDQNTQETQNSLRSPLKSIAETIDKNKTTEHHSEQINQQQDEVLSEKCCDVEKDENLNVSAKLTDVSANDSTVVNANSINESDSQTEKTLIEVKENISASAIENKSTSHEISVNECDEVKKITVYESNKIEQTNCVEPQKIADNDDGEVSSSQTKSRISVEVIYDDANQTVGDSENKSKPEIVQIDEDDEKSVLDSSAEVIYDGKNAKPKPEVVEIIDKSHEDDERLVLDSSGMSSQVQTVDKSSYESKSCTDHSMRSAESMKESSLESKLSADTRLVNGSTESKRGESDTTVNVDSDTFSSFDMLNTTAKGNEQNTKKLDSAKGNSFMSKELDNIELISISDNEMSSNMEEKNKSDLIYNSKTVQVEREIGMYLKVKCLIHMDENTKESVSKELVGVHCESAIMESIPIGRQKNEDSQSSLADISDNKDSSPGSVNSNPQPYQLNPRLSIMSSISSSSSASSAASLAAKLIAKNFAHFSIPLGPAKHAKKQSQDLSTMADKQTLDEAYEQVTREWKNHHLIVPAVLNCINTELSGLTIPTNVASVADVYVNVSNERLDDHHLQKSSNLRSSTPEVRIVDTAGNSKIEILSTPRSKKGKSLKRPRSKLTKSSVTQVNSENGSGILDINSELTLHTSVTEPETDMPSSRKKIKMADMDKLSDDTSVLANSSPRNTLVDELIGKKVFAKWSDNNFYPGTVSDRLKTKYKVNFYDGKSKTLIPEFVIPIPKILREGLSVYATTETNDYGSCGIIVDVESSRDDDDDDDDDDSTRYTVETDEGERLHVKVQDIFLSADQAQVLKEEVESAKKGSLPSTPKTLNQVTLDNMVDGKRRSKRNTGTPIYLTPKSKSNALSNSASRTKAEPSVSGMSAKMKKKLALSENDGLSSDSNIESIQDELLLRGVQREIIGTPHEQIVKGPQSRIKGKPRSKKKVEDAQTIAMLGPIPSANSNIFKGMSFILTCVPLETLDRYQDVKTPAASGTETEATETDAETENEEDWVDRPFVRDRLHTQIVMGGGKIYEDFDEIPKDEYKNTKLITNAPNTTAKSILCLSVGIPVCNHKWIIRCCLEGKIVNAAENMLPLGWSFQKRAYVETFQARNNKPLSKTIVIIPLIFDVQFATFWRKVCENAGAVVLIAEDSGAIETMDCDSDVVVVSNRKCPPWAVNRASQLRIPVLSTTWVVQCLIEGNFCPYEQHPRYKYNYVLD